MDMVWEKSSFVPNDKVPPYPSKAWLLSVNGSKSVAIYKCKDGYRIYYWGYLKNHKYKYLKEAKAVTVALLRLGEIGGMNYTEAVTNLQFDFKND